MRPLNEVANDNGTKRRALGRGLADIISVEETESQSVTAASAIPAVMKILESVEPKFHPAIFQAVQSIQRTASGESVQAIGERLHELETCRRRSTKPERRGFWKRMFSWS